VSGSSLQSELRNRPPVAVDHSSGDNHVELKRQRNGWRPYVSSTLVLSAKTFMLLMIAWRERGHQNDVLVTAAEEGMVFQVNLDCITYAAEAAANQILGAWKSG